MNDASDLRLTLLQFAIRVNSRNHSVLKRDDIIKLVAQVVGPAHKVDLKNFDALILVELYKVSRSKHDFLACYILLNSPIVRSVVRYSAFEYQGLGGLLTCCFRAYVVCASWAKNMKN